MKYFRIFITVLAMAVALGASAQSKTTSKTKSAPAKTAVKKSTTVKKTSAAPARTATATKKSATTTKKTATVAKKQDYDSSVRVMFTTKVGSCYGHGGFGENITLEKKYNPYFAVDFFSIDYSAPFNFNYMTIGVKAGVRGFTPSFWNTSAGKICRGYSSLAVGYDCTLTKYASYVADHGFGLSWGAGLEFVEKANFGYALEYNTVMKSTSHYFTIGIKF